MTSATYGRIYPPLHPRAQSAEHDMNRRVDYVVLKSIE